MALLYATLASMFKRCVELVIVAGIWLTGILVTAAELPVQLQSGFVVWESNRSGPWRIYKRDLAGGGASRLSPDEPGRDHFAAHISPDGRKLVYLSFPSGWHGYSKQPPAITIPMMIMDMDGANSRILLDNVRPYGEHRAAVWLNTDELIVIGADYKTRRLHIPSGQLSLMLTEIPPGKSFDHGYLLDPTLRYATAGLPGFHIYEAETQRLTKRRIQPGCQPFFTRDGQWGYWVRGMGGPINGYHLASEAMHTMIDKHDPRMPPERGYVYFPHISPCRRLLAFAASSNQHDHHQSDYDLFVAPLNPEKLQLSGAPVRMTSHAGTDRFPEVFLHPLLLGQYTDKAPLRINLDIEDEWKQASWRVNDTPVSIADGTLLFQEAGEYRLEAALRGDVRHGLVEVRPATPPLLLDSTLSREGDAIIIFNEPVSLEHASFYGSSGERYQDVTTESMGHRVIVKGVGNETREVQLRLEGIRDRAQRPNYLPSMTLHLRAPSWPVNPEKLVLVWESAAGRRQFFAPGNPAPQPLELTARGRARISAEGAMLLDSGSYVDTGGAANALLNACKASDQLTIEAVILPRHVTQHGPARIISFSDGLGSRNVTLGQEGSDYVLRLRTPTSGNNAHLPQITLAPVATEKHQHLTIVYRPGELTAYVDGRSVLNNHDLKGGFEGWTPHTLLFGAETGGDRDWSGIIDGIAIYNRAMNPEEVAANAREAAKRLATRKVIPLIEVEARLVEATPVPTLETIAPYRDSMVMYEYERIDNDSAVPVPSRFRVQHWGLLDGAVQPLPANEVGQTVLLPLHPADALPHLRDWHLTDTLDIDMDIAVFYDATP